MTFTINGMNYKVDFRHLSGNLDWPEVKRLAALHLQRPDPDVASATTAMVYCFDANSNVWRPFSTGCAFCWIGDTFNKETGRRLALQRAITDRRVFLKEQRRIIWEAYFGRSTPDHRRTLHSLELRLEALAGEARHARELMEEYGRSQAGADDAKTGNAPGSGSGLGSGLGLV